MLCMQQFYKRGQWAVGSSWQVLQRERSRLPWQGSQLDGSQMFQSLKC